jgi:Family of unknown function (DUF6074)
MTATIIPFPLVRQHLFIQRQINHVASINPTAGDRYLKWLRQVKAEAMRRRGIAEHLISAEVRCMEVAIRVALTRNSERG